MGITRDNPYSTAYDYYGDPSKLAEYRLFVLNECSMDCKGCFYTKNKNDFNNFDGALNLAKDLVSNGYRMETCYLLPTDMFDNTDNYKLFNNKSFKDIIGLFNFVGIATTLEHGYDEKFFDILYDLYPQHTVEIQVNLSIKRLFDINYQGLIRNNITKLKAQYGERVVINLAINIGFKIADEELAVLKDMMMELSEDGIIELNFTFLYNDDISFDNKKKMLKQSMSTLTYFKDQYKSHNSYTQEFNKRSLLTKPSFVFAHDDIYCNPIVPFDEYVYVKDDVFKLEGSTYDDFITCYCNASVINSIIDKTCETCENLEYCMAKYYFAIAKKFDLGCFMNKF